MSNAVTWNSSDSKVVRAQLGSKWPEIRQGFLLCIFGHACFLLLVLPGLLIALVPVHVEPFVSMHRTIVQEDELVLVGLVGLAAAALVGCVLILIGQWRCLTHAPQRHGSKELLFACLNAGVLGPVLLAIAHFVGGARNYPLVERGLAGLDDVEFLQVGTLLQLTGLGLCLVSFLLFSQFLRVVASCFEYEAGTRAAERFFFYICMVVGGTVGVFVCSKRLESLHEVWLGLMASWVGALVWHVSLTVNARRCIAAVLQRLDAREPARPYVPVGNYPPPKPVAGTHRTTRSPVQ
jgi:hypothetical protein